MTSPPSSPSALSSGALADEVREALNAAFTRTVFGPSEDRARIAEAAIVALAQIVARLEQAEQERADRDVLIGLMCATDVRVNGCACTETSKCYLHGVEIPRRLADGFEPVSDDEFRFMHAAAVEYVRAEAAESALAASDAQAQRWWERLLDAESALAACEAERDQWKAVASEIGVLTLTESLAACETQRDDALAALHYIRQQYGELDGVGWNRLTGDEA